MVSHLFRFCSDCFSKQKGERNHFLEVALLSSLSLLSSTMFTIPCLVPSQRAFGSRDIVFQGILYSSIFVFGQS